MKPLNKIKVMLTKKGYDLTGKTEAEIRSIYAFYLPREKASDSQWDSWKQTNRLHQ